MAKLKTSCYKCVHRKEVPGSAHSRCDKPDHKMTGSVHGVMNGWFNYPKNFDPVWREVECNNYKPKR